MTTAYPEHPGTHMIVLPGGGYAAHAPHEAEPVAIWLGEIGVPASVFRYPLNVRHPVPLETLHAEIAARRAGGARRIGLIGFSAGGHLAGLATLTPGATAEETVDFAVLGYAITSMETETYRPARLILLGENASPRLRHSTSLDALVTPQSPPFFVWHTAEEPLCPSRAHLPVRLGARGQPGAARHARVHPRPARPRRGPGRRRGRSLDHARERLDPRTGIAMM
jgi:acetyl esterase/lipase